MSASKYWLSSLIAVSTVAPLAIAQGASPSINDVDQKVRVIERKWELQEEKNKENANVSVGKEGFVLRSGDKKYELKIRGLVHADGRFFVGQPQSLGVSTFVARRVRPSLEGKVGEYFDFRILPDFGNGSTSLLDAYGDIKLLPELKFRIGKFKEPVGLERLQPVDKISFVEFGFPTSLVPNRDVGIQVFGDIKEGIASYAVGVFNGVADGASGDVDSNDGKDIAARVFFQPFLKTNVEALKGLGVGVAGTYGKQSGTTAVPGLPSYRTPGQQVFYRYVNTPAAGATPANIATSAGKVYRIIPQANYYWGPFGFQGEYVRSTHDVQDSAGRNRVTHQAWQTAATYVLTGEKASYKGLKPKNNFKLGAGWGAFELAGRYQELRIDPNAFPDFASITASARRARGFTAGLNWYLNENVKLVGNYEQTAFQGGAATGNRPNEKVIQSRLQVAF